MHVDEPYLLKSVDILNDIRFLRYTKLLIIGSLHRQRKDVKDFDDFLVKLATQEDTLVVNASTLDNSDNLDTGFIKHVEEFQILRRQEIDGIFN